MASVASAVTSSVAGERRLGQTRRPGPHPGCGATAPARRGDSGRPRRQLRHRTPPSTRSKATRALGRPPRRRTRTCRDRGRALEGQHLEEEGGSHHGRVALGQRGDGPDQHLVEARVGVPLLGRPGRPPRAWTWPTVIRSRSSRTTRLVSMHLDLVDDVEVPAALPAEQGDVAQRFEPRAELGRGPPDALGHRPHLAVLLGHQRHDPVRLAEADGAQHHAPVAEEGHDGARSGSSGREVPVGGASPAGRPVRAARGERCPTTADGAAPGARPWVAAPAEQAVGADQARRAPGGRPPGAAPR